MQAQIVQIRQSPGYSQDILRGAELLGSGKLLVLPTETVYGVAGALTDPTARAALHELRSSPNKPLTLHVARPHDALPYIGDVKDLAMRMMRKLWPGPVGLIFSVPQERRRQIVAKLGLDETDLYDGDSITIRCPDDRVFFDVVSQVDKPVALTAPGGSQRAGDLPPEALSRVEMVFDAGPTRFSKPSTLLRVKGDRYELVREGVYDQRIIDRMLKTTILFVCSGNTCRSPMAEAIARQALAQKLKISEDELERRGIGVISAGSFAMPVARATEQAVDVMKQMGLDISRHRSRPLSVELIHQADAIWTMGRSHAAAVVSLVPAAVEKVATLDPKGDVEDPIGGDEALYAATAQKIKSLVEARLSMLEQNE